jgi:hypothetical protein
MPRVRTHPGEVLAEGIHAPARPFRRPSLAGPLALPETELATSFASAVTCPRTQRFAWGDSLALIPASGSICNPPTTYPSLRPSVIIRGFNAEPEPRRPILRDMFVRFTMPGR